MCGWLIFGLIPLNEGCMKRNKFVWNAYWTWTTQKRQDSKVDSKKITVDTVINKAFITYIKFLIQKIQLKVIMHICICIICPKIRCQTIIEQFRSYETYFARLYFQINWIPNTIIMNLFVSVFLHTLFLMRSKIHRT